MPARRSLLILLLLFALVLGGCGESKDSVYPAAPSASGQTASIRIRSVLAQTTVPSEVVSFRATGFDAEQKVIFGPATVRKAAEAQWDGVPVEVTEFLVEYLDAGGRAVGVSRVRVELVAGETFAIDSPPVTLVTGTLERITVSPSSRTVSKGTTTQFTAIGTFSDGATRDLSATSTWTCGDPTVANVSQGEARGLRMGSTILTATFGNVSGTATLEVDEATVVGLTLLPSRPTIAAGTAQNFTVEGFFSDGSFRDVTTDVSFSSSNTTVSTLVGGLARGLEAGQTTVTATLGNVTASTQLTVSMASLRSITVTGPSSIARGTSADYIATGRFSDDSTQDLTGQAIWSLSPDGSANIEGGRLMSLVEGPVVVTAVFRGVSGSADLQITPAVITAIQVETSVAGAAARVYRNGTLSLKATATLSDRSTQDVTGQAEWRSDAAIATVDAGLVTGVSLGRTNVTATLSGRTGSLEVEVQTPPPLPGLVLQSGTTYAFDTTSGVLVPAVGGNAIPPGWNAGEHRFHLKSFTVQSGAVLNVKGDVPLSVVTDEVIDVAGVIDFSGPAGTNGVDGRVATDGTDGGVGGDIELLSVASITITGSLRSNGGAGGMGGGFAVASNAGSVAAGNGGNGGAPGEVSLQAPAMSQSSEASTNWGDGGAGGTIAIAGVNSVGGGATAMVVAGSGGDGGKGSRGGSGGDVTIEGNNNSNVAGRSITIQAGAGGQGGDDAPGGRGGNVVIRGSNSAAGSASVLAGAGGRGGSRAAGGDGGYVLVAGNNISQSFGASASLTGGLGGLGGVGAPGGKGGLVEIGGSNLAQDTGCSSLVTAGDGGGGGAGSPGGVGGAVFIDIDNAASGYQTRVTVLAGSGGQGGDGASGGRGGAVQLEGSNIAEEDAAVASITGGSGGRGGNPGAGGAAGSVLLSKQVESNGEGTSASSIGGRGGDGQGGGLGGAGGVVYVESPPAQGTIRDGAPGTP